MFTRILKLLIPKTFLVFVKNISKIQKILKFPKHIHIFQKHDKIQIKENDMKEIEDVLNLERNDLEKLSDEELLDLYHATQDKGD